MDFQNRFPAQSNECVNLFVDTKIIDLKGVTALDGKNLIKVFSLQNGIELELNRLLTPFSDLNQSIQEKNSRFNGSYFVQEVEYNAENKYSQVIVRINIGITGTTRREVVEFSFSNLEEFNSRLPLNSFLSFNSTSESTPNGKVVTKRLQSDWRESTYVPKLEDLAMILTEGEIQEIKRKIANENPNAEVLVTSMRLNTDNTVQVIIQGHIPSYLVKYNRGQTITKAFVTLNLGSVFDLNNKLPFDSPLAFNLSSKQVYSP